MVWEDGLFEVFRGLCKSRKTEVSGVLVIVGER